MASVFFLDYSGIEFGKKQTHNIIELFEEFLLLCEFTLALYRMKNVHGQYLYKKNHFVVNSNNYESNFITAKYICSVKVGRVFI